uniref:Uncharacterized protein n=1 Tax=Panagrolaimus sp. ES5 TaxID=591445 RepID=A0AC34G1Y4_9BILA
MLREAEDDEFICHNVEYRLGSNLLDKHLWKLYIEFLRERNPKEMLQIYSKYCRFFIGDSEVKKKYRQEAAEFGPVKVRWENLFDFELMDNKNESSDVEGYGDEIVKPELFEKITSSSIDTVKNLDVVFCDSCFHQHFSFSNPLIRYILDSANHIILRKLYQSCKYFYTKKRVPICYRLEVSPYVIPQESMRTFNCFTETFHSTLSFNNYSMLDKFYVTTVLRSINYESNNSRLLSNIISRFYQCDAKYITISDQNLSFEELQFLIGHGNVIKLDCQNVKIEYSENQPVILEDIMALLPNIKILQ